MVAHMPVKGIILLLGENEENNDIYQKACWLVQIVTNELKWF